MADAERPHAVRERLVYAVATGGHRQSYLDTLGAIFALTPVSGRMSPALFRRLVAAERLLFATLDDDMASFAAVVAARSALGRPTAALFLRAQKCFETGRWYYPLKRHAFRALRRLPRLTVASITPFDIAPRHSEVAHCGVFDPQYWDLLDADAVRRPGATPLSQEAQARAAGRRVLCAVGTLGMNKGLTFLAETLERHPHIAEHTLTVAAGRVPGESAALAARLEAAGALVIDRFITDAEIESLYGISTCIWACYEPDYDQASGVFGRAMQFGVAPILRQGSVIGSFAAANGIDHIAVPYGDHEALADLLIKPSPASSEVIRQPDRGALIGGWKRQFVAAIGRGLGDPERGAS